MNICNKIKELRVKNKVTQELIDNLNITYDEAKSVLEKKEEFILVSCADVPINDTTVELYAILRNPQIVGLISILDMVVNKPNTYYYYCVGPSNYFKNK